MEVAKTRLQLDGELQGRTHLPPTTTTTSPTSAPPLVSSKIPEAGGPPRAGPNGRVYTSAVDCMRKTWKFEGLKGIQRGLGAAVSLTSTLSLTATAADDLVESVGSTLIKSH